MMTPANDHNETTIKLNPALDTAALKKTFAEGGRIHIPNILTEASAKRVYQCLTNEVDWHLVFNEGEKTHTLFPEQVKALTEDHKAKIRQIVLSQAKNQFQYIYYDYNIYDYYLNNKNMDHFLHRFHEFVNSEKFLSFIREISGFDTITFADSQAMAFGPGHFLNMHHDEVEGKNRKMAMVFNFTPKWKLDWGGILQFPGKDGNVDLGLVPAFNALNMLAIPQDHAVSYVPPFAPEIRYTVVCFAREHDDAELFKSMRA